MAHLLLVTIHDKKHGVCNDINALKKMPKVLSYLIQASMFQTIVMTRGMWESLPKEYRPIPWRKCIVLTKDDSYVAVGAKTAKCVDDALELVETECVFFLGSDKLATEIAQRSNCVYEVVASSPFTGDKKYAKLSSKEWNSHQIVSDTYENMQCGLYVRNKKTVGKRAVNKIINLGKLNDRYKSRELQSDSR
jgi:dihydrofolate reductase